MKKNILLLLLLIFSVIEISAQTNVSGDITTNTTWTVSNSPYKLTGDVNVKNGVTLTIESGVNINLQSYYNLNLGSTYGTAAILQANGVTFNNGTILLYNNSGGTITNCNFISANIKFNDNSSPTLTNNNFDQNSSVYLHSQGVIPKMSGNTFGSQKIYISTDFTNNTTIKNYQGCIYYLDGDINVKSGSTLTIENGVTINLQTYYNLNFGSTYGTAGILQANGVTFNNGTVLFYNNSGGTITNCNFISTNIKFNDHSSPALTNNSFDQNSSVYLHSQGVIPKMSVNAFGSQKIYISTTFSNNTTIKNYQGCIYYLDGDINVNGGATLTMESSVNLDLKNYYNLNIGSTYGTAGILQANGVTFNNGAILFYNNSGGTVTNCSFINANIKFNDNSSPALTNNNFDQNSSVYLHSQGVIPKMSVNAFGSQKIYISTIFSNNTTLKNYQGCIYYLDGDINVNSGATLTFESGVNINLQNYYNLDIGSTYGTAGILQANGVTFDNGTIRFYNNSAGTVANCNFINANNKFNDNSSPALTNNSFDQNSSVYLHSQGVIPKMSGNTFGSQKIYLSTTFSTNTTLKNYQGCIYYLDGDINVNSGATLTFESGVKMNLQSYYNLNIGSSYSNAGTLQANGAAFNNGIIRLYNSSNGIINICDLNSIKISCNDNSSLDINLSNLDFLCSIENNSSNIINAINNYWDNASGPYHATLNPNGQGSKLSGNINFIPFYTSPITSVSAQPILISPLNGAINQSISLILVWNKAQGIDTYNLQLSLNSDFSSFVLNKTGLTDSIYNVTRLSGNLTYYWRVSAVKNNITGLWSAVWIFTTTDATSVNETSIPKEFALSQNYPNPFNPSTTINYSVPKSSFVTIKVYDVLGKEVTTLVNEEKKPGNYNVEFSASKLASGIYFYGMQASGFIQTRKLILLK